MKSIIKKITGVISLIFLSFMVIGASYAYFQAKIGDASVVDISVNAYTVDTFTFSTEDPISFSLDQENFASGMASLSDSTTVSAFLTANNKTNTATENYSVYFNISDNDFIYTQDTSSPELILTIKDSNNNEITSLNGLTYYSGILDNQGVTINGFDITNKTGLLTLVDNQEITTTTSKKDIWTITVSFVNYDYSQNDNAGKNFDGQVLISKESFSNYKPNTINSLSVVKSDTNLTVNLNVDNGTNEIDKYYYAIEEKNTTAYVIPTVTRLSNIVAKSSLSYVESTSSSYTFSNINNNSNYEISVYAVDKKKIKTNTYIYNLINDSYVLPEITSVTTSSFNTSIKATVTATQGTNEISKYYFSIDGGSTFIESTSNKYTFSNLAVESNYNIFTKVMDNNGNYSNIYVSNVYLNKSAYTVAVSGYKSDFVFNGIVLYDETVGYNIGDVFTHTGTRGSAITYIYDSNDVLLQTLSGCGPVEYTMTGNEAKIIYSVKENTGGLCGGGVAPIVVS